MLKFHVAGSAGRVHFDHPAGPIEFGRERAAREILQSDAYVARAHLQVEEIAGGRLRLANISQRSPVGLADGSAVGPGEAREVALPTRLTIGETLIDIEVHADDAPDATRLKTLDPGGAAAGTLAGLGETPEPERLARWFESIVAVQRSAAGSPEFYREAAHAVVDLIGLDRGLILIRDGDAWVIAARSPVAAPDGPEFSRSVVDRVVAERRTLFEGSLLSRPSASLEGVAAVVASPILDASGDRVIGVVYGSKVGRPGERAAGVRPLEAQVVQVLASAVAAGLARQKGEAEAARKSVQFEQFFSAELARELDRDPGLLEGRDREVTILAGDIRGFSRLAERLGSAGACRLARDFMDRLTARVHEHGGVVVDYAGDGILAMWNAPFDQPDHAARAARAARAMLGDLPGLNGRWAAEAGGPLGLGLGVNTGVALVGNTGSRLKLKYGPLGHAVNLASRVEGATKHLGVPALITGPTASRLGPESPTRRLCRARVQGIDGAVELHELFAGPVDAGWLARRDAYEAALGLFESGHWAEACRRLQPLIEGEGGDYDLPAVGLLGRAVEALKAQGRQFDPVLVLTSK